MDGGSGRRRKETLMSKERHEIWQDAILAEFLNLDSILMSIRYK